MGTSMPSPYRSAILLLLTVVLVIGNTLVYRALLKSPTLHVSFLNVGQGDAIFIQGPTGRDMLIDGGRDRSVLRELPKVMGPLDRNIAMIVETHPDADHVGGLAGVLKNYAVSAFLTSHIESDTKTVAGLLDAVGKEKGMAVLDARRGMRLDLGGGAYAEVLFPDRDVSTVETNTGSIVLRIVYGSTEFMLTGDSPSAIEDWLVTLDGDALSSDVLKAGHHGSRTSTDDAWLSAVSPSVVVISAGKDNSYGHPHAEVLERVRAHSAGIVSTAEKGTITFTSNGTTISKK